jgi:hypothetical protein
MPSQGLSVKIGKHPRAACTKTGQHHEAGGPSDQKTQKSWAFFDAIPSHGSSNLPQKSQEKMAFKNSQSTGRKNVTKKRPSLISIGTPSASSSCH